MKLQSSIFDLDTISSGWTWNEKRNQFYLHQFGKKQPDFNLRNDDLKKNLKVSQRILRHLMRIIPSLS